MKFSDAGKTRIYYADPWLDSAEEHWATKLLKEGGVMARFIRDGHWLTRLHQVDFAQDWVTVGIGPYAELIPGGRTLYLDGVQVENAEDAQVIYDELYTPAEELELTWV